MPKRPDGHPCDGGTAASVTDDEILQMQRDLARKEGIGVEPHLQHLSQVCGNLLNWAKSTG